MKGRFPKADDLGMVWPELVRIRWSRLRVLVLVPICCTLWLPNESKSQEEPELFPGRAITRCQVVERPANQRDISLRSRIPMLGEPENWLNAPGPHSERAEGWQGRRPGYRILDSRGHLLHSVPNVSLPRWSPDGHWLAVSHWSRALPYQLALVKVSTGKVTLIPEVKYLDDCAWSPDSRRLAFVARSYGSGDSVIAGWLLVANPAVQVVADGLNYAFECMGMAWSADSRRFVALMHREYEHDDVRVTDLWLFGLAPGACRLTVTPRVEESSVSWLDDRHVFFRTESLNDDSAQSGFGTVLKVPALAK